MEPLSMLEQIPYLENHDLDVEVGEEKVEARMDYRQEFTNYIGTLHAGALYTVAETAAGVAAYQIGLDQQALVLLRKASISYTRPAKESVRAIARVDSSDANSAQTKLERHNRADVPVTVRMLNDNGETVLKGEFYYALRPEGVEDE